MFKKILCQELLLTILVFQFLVFYGTSDFTSNSEAPPNIWDRVYYVTEAITYAAIACYFAIRNTDETLAAAWKPVAAFLIIRLIWEVYAVIFGLDVNIKIAMAILFVIISFVSFLIIASPHLKKIWRRLY